MKYAQLDKTLNSATEISFMGNIEWDSTHFCPASALTPDEAHYFRVVQLSVTEPPLFDKITQSAMRDGCEQVMGLWQYQWTVVELFSNQAEKDAAIKTALTKEIDAAIIGIYDRPMSLSKEYESREKAAAEYKAAGYTGPVPPRLAGFSTPAGMPAKDAADLVLKQSASMRNALDLLGDLRMRKYEVQRAKTDIEARDAQKAILAQVSIIAAALA